MAQSKILTLTLNPSLDRTLKVHYLNVGYHNRVSDTTRLDPAGAGVSISRALHRLGTDTHAIVLLGDDPVGLAYEALLSEEEYDKTVIISPGRTGSDTVIVDTGNEAETHLIEDGTSLTVASLDELQAALAEAVEEGDTIVFAGPLPPHSPKHAYRRLISAASGWTVNTVVSVDAQALADLLPAQPQTATLTQQVAEAYFNFPVRSWQDIAYCARQLRGEGVPCVLIEMLDTGNAFLATEEGNWLLELPEESAGTSSGVKEALLAGFLAGVAQKRPLADALLLAGAAATFTAAQIGSEFAVPEDLRQHYPDITVTAVEELPGEPPVG